MAIKFYKLLDDYGCFSNFSDHPFELKGKTWITSEHYFQAMKFEGTNHEDEIRECPGPWSAAKQGRSRDRPLRPDWEQIKEDVMYDALRAKFDAHPDIREILLSTKDETIIEVSKNDSYWAEGPDGKGQNRLGYLLEKLRNAYRVEDLDLSNVDLTDFE